MDSDSTTPADGDRVSAPRTPAPFRAFDAAAAGATTGTARVADAAELAVVERSGFVESRHAGSAIVIDPSGEVVRVVGDPAAAVFPRSALKPFQALAAMSTGLELRGPTAAIAMGSHTGTARHVGTVRSMLAAAALDESDLRCPASWPKDADARADTIRAGGGPTAVAMECSGKHAALLAASVRLGADVRDYLDPEHPIEVRVREIVERMTGAKVLASGVDGCGTPVYAMSLESLARGIQRIGTAAESSPFALFRNAAVLSGGALGDAWAVDGPGRSDTLLIDRLGVFAKHGAEGLQVIVTPSGHTVAVKVLDGSTRVGPVVALTLLAQERALAPADVAAVLPDLHLTISGGGEPVGSIRPTVR